MNKKLVSYFAIGFVGLTFVFAFIGIFVASMVMCILAMIFALGALACLLLFLFYKDKPKQTPTPTSTAGL